MKYQTLELGKLDWENNESMTTATQHLESIGHLCASLRQPYARIRKTVDQLNLKAAVTINGVEHYSAEQCELIADAIRGTAEPTK